MLVVFKNSGKWSNGSGVPQIVVKAGEPVEVSEWLANLAIPAGRAEMYTEKQEGNPAHHDKARAEGNPAKKNKKKARKK